MNERRFVYTLGVIKWVNLMTFFIFLSNMFRLLEFSTELAIFMQLLFVAIVSFFINKAFEKKFGKENLVENTKAFKIVNIVIIVIIAMVLIIKGQIQYLIFIMSFMIIFTLIMMGISTMKKKRML